MPGTTTRLFLARHGEAAYESGVWDDEGGSLTALGREQARRLGDRMAGHGITGVWTSTFARAVQTGEIAAARLGVPVTTRSDLREFGPGDLAGTSLAEDPFLPTFARWLAGDLHVRIPGGESGSELIARFDRAMRWVTTRHGGESVLVVAHGGIMRVSVPNLTRMDVAPQRIANCAVIQVEQREEGWVCAAWDAPE